MYVVGMLSNRVGAFIVSVSVNQEADFFTRNQPDLCTFNFNLNLLTKKKEEKQTRL